MKEYIRESMTKTAQLIAELIHEEKYLYSIEEISRLLIECFVNGKKVLICGNGGSSTDAMHFAEELTGRFRDDRKPLAAIALTDPSHITCVANDYGFDMVFSRAVEAYGKKGDVLIGISTSGNSKNVRIALEKARKMGMITIALLGKDGGRIKGICSKEIIVPSQITERIQEIHGIILHLFIEMIERQLFPENYEKDDDR